jgi:hypothetical protein
MRPTTMSPSSRIELHETIKKEFLENRDRKANPGDAAKDINAKNTDFNFIKYISLSLDDDADYISFRGNISVNREDPAGDMLLNVLTTGLFENALFADNPSGYHFLSIDLSRMNEYFNEKAGKNKSAYRTFSRMFIPDNNPGFLEEAVLPCSKSFINIILKKPRTPGEMDNFIVYVPMNECGDIEKTFEIIKKETERNHPGKGNFGEEKIDGHESFWFKNGSSKINILEHNGDIYAGNNADFIAAVLNSAGKKSKDINNDFIKRIDKNSFLVSYTQFDDESFIKAILMMLAYNSNAELYQFIGKTGSIYLTGQKNDNDLLFHLRLKMLRSK